MSPETRYLLSALTALFYGVGAFLLRPPQRFPEFIRAFRPATRSALERVLYNAEDLSRPYAWTLQIVLGIIAIVLIWRLH